MSRKSIPILIILLAFITALAGCVPVSPVPASSLALPATFEPQPSPTSAATPESIATSTSQPQPEPTAATDTLRLLAPDISKPVELAPAISWQAMQSAASYSVWIIDAGTTELVLQQEVGVPSLTPPQPLKPGRSYDLEIQALNAEKKIVASLRTGFTTAGEAVAPEDEPIQQLPGVCHREGSLTYADRDTRLCFAYPQGFALAGSQGKYAAGSQSLAELRGPALGSGPEPLFARLSLDFQPYQGDDLASFVDKWLAANSPAELASSVERTEATWSGHAAVILEPVPGRMSSRVVIVDAAPGGYNILSFGHSFKGMAREQLGMDALQAQQDMETLFEIVAATFAKLPPPGVPLDAATRLELPKSCLVSGQPLHADVAHGYCFALTPEMLIDRPNVDDLNFYGPALDDSPDPLRTALAVIIVPAPKDLTLDKVVEAYIASLGGPVERVGREQINLGDAPAEILYDVPGRPTATEVLTLRDGKLFRFRFTPGAGLAGAQPEATRLVEAVTSSFGWLPRGDQGMDQAGNTPVDNLVQSEPYGGASFSYPQMLASSTAGETVPAGAEPGGPWWGVWPEHVEIRLEGYLLPQTLHTPRVVVYPVAEYAHMSVQAAAQVAALQKLLDAKPVSPADQMPFLPLLNAGQQMHLRVQYHAFRNGEGVSYLTQFAQGLVPINNSELIYTFQGLTADGRYYVSAILPVKHVSLPATADEMPQAQMEALMADFPGYVNDVTGTLARGPESAFTPTLAGLDALVESIEAASE